MSTQDPTASLAASFAALNSKALYLDYDHVTFYVGSVKAAACYLIDKYGFKPYCQLSLETGSRTLNSLVVKNGKVILQLQNSVVPLGTTPGQPVNDLILKHIAYHGDGVRDVAFQVRNVEEAYKRAMENGGKSVMKPTTFKDEFGQIQLAQIGALGDVIHTLVDRTKYSGFMPGPYKLFEVEQEDNHYSKEQISMDAIDHIVQNDTWNMMNSDCEYYEKVFGFHKFWSVDESQIHTQYSALKSTVMASENEVIKLPVNEPAKGLRTSQIEEFMEFFGAPGIQHVALRVDDILEAVDHMRKRGVEFIRVPDKYYDNLEERLAHSKHPSIQEDLKMIRKLGILVDFDEKGYLLQLFTKPVFDRPTFFFEIIQRHNHNGFGAGNFRSLFEVLEGDQERRGNLRVVKE